MKTAIVFLILLCPLTAWVGEPPAEPSVGCRVQAVEMETKTGWFVTHHGSGVAIGRREILTAAHVVDAKGVATFRVEVASPGKSVADASGSFRWVACTLGGIDRERDLAVLIAGEDLPNFALLAADKHATLFMVASGEARPVSVSSGFITAAKADFGDMAHGKSGGAVLDGSGRLVGLVLQGEPLKGSSSAMRPDVTWFIAAGEIRKFLAKVLPAKKF